MAYKVLHNRGFLLKLKKWKTNCVIFLKNKVIFVLLLLLRWEVHSTLQYVIYFVTITSLLYNYFILTGCHKDLCSPWNSMLYFHFHFYDWISQFCPHFPHHGDHRALHYRKTQRLVIFFVVTCMKCPIKWFADLWLAGLLFVDAVWFKWAK